MRARWVQWVWLLEEEPPGTDSERRQAARAEGENDGGLQNGAADRWTGCEELWCQDDSYRERCSPGVAEPSDAALFWKLWGRFLSGFSVRTDRSRCSRSAQPSSILSVPNSNGTFCRCAAETVR